jgi:tetratricopeptide (TPR) repeat protein
MRKLNPNTAGEVLLAAALVLMLGWAARKPPAPSIPRGAPLLLADFEGLGVAPETGAELKQILRLSLNQTDAFTLFPQAKLRDALRLAFRDPDAPLTPARARQVCLREGIPAYLIPRLSSLQTGSIVTVGLVHVGSADNGETALTAVRAPGSMGNLYAMEELGRRVRRALGEESNTAGMSGTLLPTPSPGGDESLHWFARALVHFDKGEYDNSQESLERAVTLNPGFPLARMRLASLYDQGGRTREAKEQASVAYNLLITLPPKERFRSLGLFDSLLDSYPDALQHLEALRTLYPDDYESHFDLAEAALRSGNVTRAIDGFRKTLLLNDNHIESYLGLSKAYLLNDNAFAAREAWQQAFVLEPEAFQVMCAGASIDLMENNVAGAIEKLRGAASSASPRQRSWSNLLLAQAQIYGGRFQAAIATLDAGIADDQHRGNTANEADKRLVKAALYLLLDDPALAVGECHLIVRLTDDPIRLARAGALFARAGHADEASNIANLIGKNNQDRFQTAQLQGEIALSAYRTDVALRYFEQAKESQPLKLPMESLARASAARGSAEDAAKEYQTVCQSKSAMLLVADSRWFLGTWVRTLYDAAIVMLQLGRKAEAHQLLRNYIWVLDGADPDLPTLTQAKSLLKSK